MKNNNLRSIPWRLFLCLGMAMAFHTAEAQSYRPEVGIWYSTWYSTDLHYHWGYTGANTQTQLLGDVNGDGLDDAVVYHNLNWHVALSDGGKFQPQKHWFWGLGQNSDGQYVADVNGDGKADAIVHCKNAGGVYVSLSDGSRFLNYGHWGNGHGTQASKLMFEDINGDGRADLVAYYGDRGRWMVSLSNGNGFNPPYQWKDGHGIGSSHQLVGDATGDGKPDAMVEFRTGGQAYVAPHVGGYSLWKGDGMPGQDQYFLADINNDGRADLVAYKNNRWHVAYSNGWSFGAYAFWKYNGGYRRKNEPDLPAKCFVARVAASRKMASVAYLNGWGQWRVLPNNPYYFMASVANSWEHWLVKYKPIVNGVARQYDSGDPAVVDAHLQAISSAGIKFLLLDLTNNIHVDNGFISSRAKKVIRRIKRWNDTHPSGQHLYYCIAIGGVQFNPGNLAIIENECRIVMQEFIGDASLGGASTYYHTHGRPFITCYYGWASVRQGWGSYGGSKQYANRFDFRWMNGTKDPNNRENRPFGDVAAYPGWGLPNSGETPNKTLMVAMPGWNNHLGSYVSRNVGGNMGGYYQQRCWDRIHQAKPGMVVINSFNEYVEETAVEPANTQAVEGSTERWPSPGFYWDITKNNLARLRASARLAQQQAATGPLGLYPNPTSGTLAIGHGDGDTVFQIYNAVGRKVLSGQGRRVDTRALPSGWYVLRTAQGGHQRFLKR